MAEVLLGPRSLHSVSAMEGEAPFLGARTRTWCLQGHLYSQGGWNSGPWLRHTFSHLFFFLVDDLFFSDYESNACLMGEMQKRIRKKLTIILVIIFI